LQLYFFILQIFNISFIVPADNRLLLSLLGDGQRKVIGSEQLILSHSLPYRMKVLPFFVLTRHGVQHWHSREVDFA
jgi:hypothetical protein